MKPTPKAIKLIVTGDMERRALTTSLACQFPKVTMAGEPVDWLQPSKVNEATSSRWEAGKLTKGALTLANHLVSEVWTGSRADAEPADLVLVVCDLEGHNRDQPQVVLSNLRLAVEQEIQSWALTSTAEARLRAQLQEKGGVHLLCPMVEAYFFGGEDSALRAFGIDPAVRRHLADPDPERFECRDPAWLPKCVLENEKRQALIRPEPWWREACHPKHYLEHLMPSYDEVRNGAPVLGALDWPRVPTRPDTLAFARALFEDLADFFGVASPLGPGVASPLTCPPPRARGGLLLRNL